jgi:exosortase
MANAIDQTPPGARTGGTMSVPTRVAIALGSLLLLTFGAVFWFFLSAQFRAAIRLPADWGHTLLVPFIVGFLIWQRRADLEKCQPFRPAWSGLPLLVVGLAFYFVAYLGPKSLIIHHNARGIGVAMSVFGIALLLFGWRAMRYLWFPLAYLCIFGQYVSDGIIKPITERLQDLSAICAWGLLNLIAIDTDRDGNVLTVWKDGVAHPLNVAEACSGMRMLFAFVALGVLIAYEGLPRLWQRTILVAMSLPVGVGVNVLRIATLGILATFDMNFAAGEFHNFVGLVWLVPALFVYLGILWILRNLVVEVPTAAPGGSRAV